MNQVPSCVKSKCTIKTGKNQNFEHLGSANIYSSGTIERNLFYVIIRYPNVFHEFHIHLMLIVEFLSYCFAIVYYFYASVRLPQDISEDYLIAYI